MQGQVSLHMEKYSPLALVEARMLLVKHNVEELLPLVEEQVKEALVGEEDLAGLLIMVNDGGPQSKVS